ncbi:hypothetical protein [Kitasatospora sp. NPDC088134]|uniref:hypothetical protein n=1 Tax=Kitasatospora sp. NPDC088134 TaxID=3364071 RepID=UPI0038217AD7
MPISENTGPSPAAVGPSATLVRLAEWRTRSRVCAVIDLVAAAAGAALLLLAAVDSLVSWPSDRVLLSHETLTGIAEPIVFPLWLWLIASLAPRAAVIILQYRTAGPSTPAPGGAGRSARLVADFWGPMFPDRRVRIGLGVAALLCLGVVVGGFAVGGSNGSARVRPGPTYQVSVPDLNHSDWTDVPREQYDRRQAEFVRADGLFTFFGLALAAGGLGLRRLHRRPPRQGRPAAARRPDRPFGQSH